MNAGSYNRLLLLNGFVPLTSLLTLILLALAPPLLFQTPLPESHPPLLPHPLPSLLLAAAIWSFTHLLRVPTYTVLEYVLPDSPTWGLVSPALHALISDVLRLLSFPLLFSVSCHVPILSEPPNAAFLDGAHPQTTWTSNSRSASISIGTQGIIRMHGPTWNSPLFSLVWYFALGWSALEVSYAVAQTYNQLALYEDVLVAPPNLRLEGEDDALYDEEHGLDEVHSDGVEANGTHRLVPRDYAGERTQQSQSQSQQNQQQQRRDTEAWIRTASPDAMDVTTLSEEALEEELEKIVCLKARQELEEVYGMPVVVGFFLTPSSLSLLHYENDSWLTVLLF
jgi:hypothetical protein